MSDPAARIAANIACVRERMAEAAARSGRAADAVRLVAVTKYVDAAMAAAVVQAGGVDLGESRPQELWDKAEALRGLGVRWHLIGPLQRNKVRRTLPEISLLHSADSLRLLEAVDRIAAELQMQTPALLEVNISGDTNKQGFFPDEIESLLPRIATLANVRVRGLMAMASLTGGSEDARRDFVRLRELRDRLATSLPPPLALDELSMGMSGDFEAAIEEGATIVRVGSALFEGIEGHSP